MVDVPAGANPGTAKGAEPSNTSKWARRYPPLLSLVVALLIAFLVLPSSLNLPQSNPTTVLEFAPVPPDDDTPPPPQQGSLSTLGLGSSSSLNTDVGEVAAPLKSDPNDARGDRASTKRCVGEPLRQTEDPNSPPCVPFFDGDNGGATWQGVTKDQVTVLIYFSGGTISDQSETENGDTSAGENTPRGVYCDLDQPSSTKANELGCNDANTKTELSSIIATRALARYFNDRFQTYKRHIHFYVYWGCAGGCTPSKRRAEASDNWTVLKPFAAVDLAHFGGYNDSYADAMARRNTMMFGSYGALPNRFYRTLAPLLWSFWPDVEHDVDMYTSYVCSKIIKKNASRAQDNRNNNNQAFNGKERKYAIVSTTDDTKPGLQLFARLAKPKLQACGLGEVVDITIPESGYTNDTGGDQTYASRNVAKMKGEKVSTVLWMAGMEPKTSAAADQASYYPEWVLAGDRHNDDLINGRAQNQQVWASAWTATAQLREDRFADTPARQAYREADPNGRQIYEYYATLYYRDIFTLMRGIQVAGPQLSPQSVDQGNHAIPRYSSNNAFVAACFYDSGDYSCVKDAQESWWDPNAADPNGEAGQKGCWRMTNKGTRFLAGTWPKSDISFNASTDVCNGLKGAGINRLPV